MTPTARSRSPWTAAVAGGLLAAVVGALAVAGPQLHRLIWPPPVTPGSSLSFLEEPGPVDIAGPQRPTRPLQPTPSLGGDRWPSHGHYAKRVHLEAHRIRGRVSGPLASLEVHRTYVNRYPYIRPGDDVRDTIVVPPVTALHTFWITEHGKKIPAVLRGKDEARADFEATVARTKDPGLLEWTQQGTYAFALYPVLRDGTPKQACWGQDSVLEPDAQGVVRLPLSLGTIRTRSLEVDVEVHEPRGVAEWFLPEGMSAEPVGEGRWRLRGEWRSLTSFPPTLELGWRLPRPTRALPSALPALRVAPDGYVAQGLITDGLDHPVVLTLLGRTSADAVPPHPGHMVEGPVSAAHPVYLEEAATAPLEVPAEVFERLRGIARVHAAYYQQGDAEARARTLASLSRRHRVVTPAASLYAKPGLADTSQAWLGGDALEEQARREVRGSSPEPRVSLDFGGPFLPNFQAARRRSNLAACFANQKTIAGAVEMYNLDFNTDAVKSWPTANSIGGVRVRQALFAPRAGADVVAAHWHEFRGRRQEGRTHWLRMRDMAGLLESEGYLQQFPMDPGFSDDDTYIHLDHYGNGIFCTNHGFIQPPGGERSSPREQLRAAGVREPELLHMASPVLRSSSRQRVKVAHCGEVELFLLLLMLDLLWSLGLWVPWRRSLAAGVVGFLGVLLPLILLVPLPSLAPVFRWGLTLSWIGLGLLCAVLSLGMLRCDRLGDWLHPGRDARSCDHPWRRESPKVRQAMHQAVRDHAEYLGSLFRTFLALCGGLGGIALVLGLAAEPGLHAWQWDRLLRNVHWILGPFGILLGLGFLSGTDLFTDTLKWIHKKQGEAFWSRHTWRGLLLMLFTLYVIAMTLGAGPLPLGFALVTLGCLTVPRYGLAAHFLRRYADELAARGGLLEER